VAEAEVESLEVARLKRCVANLEKDLADARAQRDQALKDLELSDNIRGALVKSASDAAATCKHILDRFTLVSTLAESAIELRKAEQLKNLDPKMREALLEVLVRKFREKTDLYIKALEASS
jgi:hypothetical protein